MPGSFHTEVDRYWTGWSRRVTWRKMEEKKNTSGQGKEMTSTEHCPSELSGCSFRSNLWAQPTSQVPVGTREIRGKRQVDKGNFRRQIKGKHRGRPGEGKRAEGRSRWPEDRPGTLPETKEHLPLGGQEGASQRLVLKRKKRGRFRSQPW